MPVYTYVCPKCKNRIEKIHKMTESPEIKCEECGERMTIELQPTSFELKGKGWPSKDIKGR